MNKEVIEWIDKKESEFSQLFGFKCQIIYDEGRAVKEVPSLEEVELCATVFLRELLFDKPYINSDTIRSKSRKTEVVSCRHAACLIAYEFNYKYTTIGRHFDKDHSTIFHSVNKAKSLMETRDAFMINTYRTILKKVYELMEKKRKSNGFV